MRRSSLPSLPSLPSLAALSLNHCGPVVPTSVKRRDDDSEDEGESPGSPGSPASPANKKAKSCDDEWPDPDAEWLQAADSNEYRSLYGWANVMNDALGELLDRMWGLFLEDANGEERKLDTFNQMTEFLERLWIEETRANGPDEDFFKDLLVVMRQLEIDYRGASLAGTAEDGNLARAAAMHFKENLREWNRLNELPMDCPTRTVANCRAVLDVLLAHPVLAAFCYTQFDEDDPEGLKGMGYT